MVEREIIEDSLANDNDKYFAGKVKWPVSKRHVEE